MYLLGAFVSGQMQRSRGKIVAVGIVNVLSSNRGGGQKHDKLDVCLWGEGKHIGA